MKKLYFTSVALIVFFSSCSDFLELEPEHEVSEVSFYQTEEDFETATIGIYSELQNLYDAEMIYVGELTTDNAEFGWSTPTTSEVELDEINVTPNNNFINNIWNSNYRIILWANNILTRIDDINLNDDLKEQYRGEAKFLRAYSYFNLVRLFGNLPIVTQIFNSPEEIGEYDMSRKPVDQVYELIIADLEQASTHLQDAEEQSKSRASVGAVKTLLGKVYLTRNEYSQTLDVLGEVIASGRYVLQDEYGTLFTNNNDELPETIFEVKYLSGNIGEGNTYSTIFTPASFNAGIFPGNMNGSGRILPTPDLRNAYQPSDVRREASIEDSLLLQDGTFEQSPYGLKFVDFTIGIPGDGGINFIPLRYADVLLMYAEALNELERTSEAYPYINQVRKRAGLNGLSDLSQDEFRLTLEKERRLEFFQEGHRWFDLVRTNRAMTVLNEHFEDMELNFSVTEKELLMPLPQREMDINPNLNQNPGY